MTYGRRKQPPRRMHSTKRVYWIYYIQSAQGQHLVRHICQSRGNETCPGLPLVSRLCLPAVASLQVQGHASEGIRLHCQMPRLGGRFSFNTNTLWRCLQGRISLVSLIALCFTFPGCSSSDRACLRDGKPTLPSATTVWQFSSTALPYGVCQDRFP